MQIYEITRLNENVLGAFGAGFAQGAGLNVPARPEDDRAGSYVSGVGDARQKSAAAAAKPLIAAAAKKEMQGWNTAVTDLLRQRNLSDRAQLTQSDQQSLRTDLRNRVHDVLMRGQLGSEYNRDFPARVDKRSQGEAKEIVNRLNRVIQSITNFRNNPAADAAQQMALWQELSQASYDAMSLVQFHPAINQTTASAGAVTGPMPKILGPNPNGSYNIGNTRAGELTSNPVDALITQKIQAELKATPGRLPEIRSNSDGSINIGSQQLNPRNPDETKAIQRIRSLVTASGAAPPPAPGPAPTPPTTANPAGFNAANVTRLPGMNPQTPGSSAMGNMANQLTRTTAESKRR